MAKMETRSNLCHTRKERVLKEEEEKRKKKKEKKAKSYEEP